MKIEGQYGKGGSNPLEHALFKILGTNLRQAISS